MRYSASADELSTSSRGHQQRDTQDDAFPREPPDIPNDGKARANCRYPPSAAKFVRAHVCDSVKAADRVYCRNWAAGDPSIVASNLVRKRFSQTRTCGPTWRLTTLFCAGLPCRSPCCLRPSHARHAGVRLIELKCRGGVMGIIMIKCPVDRPRCLHGHRDDRHRRASGGEPPRWCVLPVAACTTGPRHNAWLAHSGEQYRLGSTPASHSRTTSISRHRSPAA